MSRHVIRWLRAAPISRFDFRERDIDSHAALRPREQIEFTKLALDLDQIAKPEVPTVFPKRPDSSREDGSGLLTEGII